MFLTCKLPLCLHWPMTLVSGEFVPSLSAAFLNMKMCSESLSPSLAEESWSNMYLEKS